jgi:hypothetical protein
MKPNDDRARTACGKLRLRPADQAQQSAKISDEHEDRNNRPDDEK